MRRFHVPRPVLLGLMVLSLSDSNQSKAEEGQVPDPEQWYLESYSPVWSAEPWMTEDHTIRFYAAEIQDHEPGGRVVSYESAPWAAGLLALWKEEGWLGSDIAALKVHRINESTVSFVARWDDRYKDSEAEVSCGWYLADLMDGQWKFTHYATIDCSAHGF